MKIHSQSIMHKEHCETRTLLFGSSFSLIMWIGSITPPPPTKKITNPYIPPCLPLFSRPRSVCLSCWISSVFLSCCGRTKGTKDREETVSFSYTVVSGGVQHSTVESAGRTGWTGGSLRTRPWDCWQQIRVRSSLNWGLLAKNCAGKKK